MLNEQPTPPPELKIIDLKDQPEHLETLARWHHTQWSYLNPNANIQQRIKEMQTYLLDQTVPSTFIALIGFELAGSAAIIENDMDTHMDLSPWLASVYVAENFRNMGIGSALVKHAMEFAGQNDVETLYLFTDEQVPFYKNLGWHEYMTDHYRSVDVTIMKANLISSR